jgi:NADH:ubiquinone oxidoreductase subunit D
VSVGSLNINDAISYGATGPVLRSVGVKKDMRFLKSETYAHYWFLSVQGYLGKRGDSYDRFLIRMREMYESIHIVFQLLTNVKSVAVVGDSDNSLYDTSNSSFLSFFEAVHIERMNKLSRNTKHTSMESLINHFKYYSEGIKVPRGFTYKAVEAPKGEFGVSLISDGTSNPYRCKIRTPAYHHMQIMPRLVQGHYFADLVTVLGSLDIVFGDVDR